MPSRVDSQLVEALLRGERRALARALSLVESSAEEDRDAATELLEALHPHRVEARRIGITGSPGVGKSTLIEAWGTKMAEAGHKLAVLAVDPSSRKSGGSILGDKTRMPKLSNHANVVVRPSPSRTALGGATTSMRESIVVCEAAGFDTIIVETVGVGQSESEVADMVDLFVLLVLPNAGDEVQGIKRGIMEMADVVLVTKTDVDNQRAQLAVATYKSALRLMLPSQPEWESPVVGVSAYDGSGLDVFVKTIDAYFATERQPLVAQRRALQRRMWFDSAVREHVVSSVLSAPDVRERLTTHQSRNRR
ncbi:MAG: methylmalonyl Co-A mutase-associated GTPase MeaB [bacterium]|nr:methylmalonyl Co-A mutase-associated GTPase MeaB [bacterium]